MSKGKCKWWNSEKGFGFLTSEEGKDVFCHFTAIQMPGRRDLTEGDKVDFDIVQSEKGPKAANVVKSDA